LISIEYSSKITNIFEEFEKYYEKEIGILVQKMTEFLENI
jgi:hypothetical protein